MRPPLRFMWAFQLGTPWSGYRSGCRSGLSNWEPLRVVDNGERKKEKRAEMGLEDQMAQEWFKNESQRE